MRTFKRTPNNVNTKLSSYDDTVKYFNQLQWNGLVENKNIFDVDQNSQADAKNVYVDGHGTLRSRPALLREPLDREILPINSKLIDMISYGKVTIYISDNEYNFQHHYKITAKGTNTAILNDIQEYHISTVKNYIICFNNLGAKVFDINNQAAGWQEFSNFTEVPVIQRVVGSEVTNYGNNQFTTRYKKEYIRTNASQPELPDDYTVSNGIDVIVNAQGGPYKWHMPVSTDKGPLDKTRLMQYMTFRKLNATVDTSMIGTTGACEQGRFSVAGQTICISTDDGVLVSFDNGDTFTKEYLPYIQDPSEEWIASITDDGLYYMRVNHDGVHVLHLSKLLNKDDIRWEVIYPWNDSSKSIKGSFTTFNLNLRSKGYQYLAHFVTRDIFSFVVETNVGPVLWFMAPGLVGHSSIGYDPNATIVNTGYKKPILSEDTIAADKVGTLCCSEIFQRDFANSFCLLVENKLSWSGSVESAMRGASLRIVKDHGTIIDGVEKDGASNSGTTKEADYYTLVFTIMGNRNSNEFFTTIILPGSQCIRYDDNTYEALAFDSRHWNKTFATAAIFGQPPSTAYGGGDEVHSNTAYAIANTTTTTESYPVVYATGSTSWLQTYQPQSIRVDSIKKIDTWTVGKYAGKVPEDKTQYHGYASIGLWQIKGSVYLQNLPTLLDDDMTYRSRYSGTNWYEFTAEVGYSDTGSIFGAFKLTARMVASNSQTVPFKTANSDYFIAQAAYTPEYNSYTNMDSYSNWLDTPTGIWTNDLSRKFSETLGVKGNILFVRCGTEIYTNSLNDKDTAQIQFTYGTSDEDKYTKIPQISYYDNTQLFLGFENTLSITDNTKDDSDNILFNLPKINNRVFIENLTNIINISTTEAALFFEDSIIICVRVEDSNLGYRYDYYPTKLSTGTRLGDNVINTIEGTYTIFPTKRGLAFMNYQAFMATTDQVLTYMTDNIGDRYDAFYAASKRIKLVQIRDRLFVTNDTGDILIYDFTRGQWWFWELPKLQFGDTFPIHKIVTDQVDTYIVGHRLFKFGDPERLYLDFEGIENDVGEDSYLTPMPTKIDWFIISQPLHMKAPNYYKNLKQLVFHLLGDESEDKQHSILVQIRCYRKKLDTKEPELISFKIEELRTFVKRFNYWKINEIQYGLASDNDAVTPTQLRLNGVSIKYEIGEEVR